jgi:Flp pilus assembly pilin Flp
MFKKRQLGQGMTEYIIIVALIAIAAIAAFKFFGGTVQTQVGGIATELAGGDGATAVTQAQGLAGSAVTEGKELEGMSTYTGQEAVQGQ